MTPTRKGSFRFARIAGTDLFLHWSWFVVAVFSIRNRSREYSSPIWNVLEYLALFLIVLLHEFGHVLACRQVGGKADQIVLWPLGGVAYVDPPQRPGATLWSIVAGPLVNVVLTPVLVGLVVLSSLLGWTETMPSLDKLLKAVLTTNVVLLIFNLLPIYPLDGGQILRSLLWFVLGRARSLMVVTVIGFAGVAALIGFAGLAALTELVPPAQSIWIGIMATFIFLTCFQGLMHARALSRTANAPRHQEFACPSCKAAPPKGTFWGCGNCRAQLDIFESRGTCPKCGAQFAKAICIDCGGQYPIDQWIPSVV